MIEDNTQHYLQLNPEKGTIFDRVNELRSEIKKFVTLFLYSKRDYFREEYDLNLCIILDDSRFNFRHCVQNQYAGLLGLLSLALPNRDLLFHLMDQDHEFNKAAHEFYKIIVKGQDCLKKFTKEGFIHPKCSASFNRMSQQYISSYLTFIYWRHINIPNIQNELKFPIEILENIISFM